MRKYTTYALVLSLLFVAHHTTAQDCSSFFPFKKGATFTHQHSDAKGKVSSVVKSTVLEVQQSGGGDATAQMQGEVFDRKDKFINKMEYNIICKGGTIIFDVKHVALANMQGNALPEGGAMEMSIEGSNNETPADLKVGSTLKDYNYTMKVKMGMMNIMNNTFRVYNRKVEASESITVPAGTYQCLRISQSMDMKLMGRTRTYKSTEWIAKGVGMVKSESYDDKGKLSGSSILIEFK